MTAPGSIQDVTDLEVDAPHSGEVLIRVHWCSVCHSDLHALDGLTPPLVPNVLGHEAAGIVEAVGNNVDRLVVGDHVTLTMVGPCGACDACVHGNHVACTRAGGRGGILPAGGTRFSLHGETVMRAMRVGGFAELTVVSQHAAVRVPKDLPLDLASLLGCSIQTGYGAVVNIAQVGPGDVVGVIGLGAVGIAAVQAARICGATQIVGIDPLEGRRELASKLGATATVPAADFSAEQLQQWTGGRDADSVIDTVSSSATAQLAIGMLRSKGRVVLVGVSAPGARLQLDAGHLVLSQKQVMGCYLGDCLPARDIPAMIDLWRSGALDLESMVTGRRPLNELSQAFDDLRDGVGLRTAIRVTDDELATLNGTDQ